MTEKHGMYAKPYPCGHDLSEEYGWPDARDVPPCTTPLMDGIMSKTELTTESPWY